MTECPRCHAILPEPPERFCPHCGADLAAGGHRTAGGGGGYPPPPGSPPGGYRPPPGYPPGRMAPGGSTPWERRDQLGFFNALVETTRQVLSGPADFFRAMPLAGGLGAPMLYAVIVGYVGLVASTIYNTVFRSLLGTSLSRMGGSSELERFAPFLQGGAGLVVNLLFGPVFILIGLFIGSGIIHLMLMIIGGAERGFEATFRVAAYSEAAALFNIIPLCGGLIGGVYTLVLLIIGVSEAQGISRGKAAVAVLVPIVVLCCCCGAVIGVAVGGLAGALGHMNR